MTMLAALDQGTGDGVVLLPIGGMSSCWRKLIEPLALTHFTLLVALFLASYSLARRAARFTWKSNADVFRGRESKPPRSSSGPRTGHWVASRALFNHRVT